MKCQIKYMILFHKEMIEIELSTNHSMTIIGILLLWANFTFR